MATEIQYKRLCDIGTFQNVSEKVSRMLKTDPFADDANGVIQLVGLYNGEVAGGESLFPVLLNAKGSRIKALGGAELWVDPGKRKSKLGLLLPEAMWKASPSKIALCAATSQDALPVYQFLGYTCFLMPRYIALWKSRSLLERRLSGPAKALAILLVDLLLACYATISAVVVKIATRGFSISELNVNDCEALAAAERLISEDAAMYSEVHDGSWLRWHCGLDPNTKVYLIRKDRRDVGMFMTGRKFYKQASHRGYKNVWLGSILEWQIEPMYRAKLKWFLLKAALLLREAGVDAVDLPTVDTRLQSFMKRIGWHRVGESNFVIKVGEPSGAFAGDEYKDPNNWRLRPAMADVGLA